MLLCSVVLQSFKFLNHLSMKQPKTWIDPRLAYILPTGGEKVVKVVLEGDTQVNDFKNRDNSMEIHVYKKMGAAILTHYNWAIYENTGITQTFDSPYGV